MTVTCSVRRALSLGSLAFGLPVVAGAQGGDTAKVTPIVTTATRVPVDARSLPQAVTVITGEELRLRGVTSLSDALLGTTSIAVAQSGSFGGVTSLFMRGGESKYVKVLVDGVAVNDPGGAFDFGSLTTDNIERIEIVRGPSSVLYGADAVTGVIQIITRGGSGPATTTVDARAGTYHSADATATIQGGAGAAGGYSLSVARHQTDGIYDYNNQFAASVVSGQYRFAPDDKDGVTVSVRYTDNNYHYPTNSGGDEVDHNAYNAGDRTVLGAVVRHTFAPTAELVVTLASNETAGGTNDQPDVPLGGDLYVSVDDIRRRSADASFNLRDPHGMGVITLGGQVEAEDENSQSQAVFGTFPSNSMFAASRRNRAVYAQALWTGVPRWTFVVGGRVDDNQQFGSFGTYRAGANWQPLDGLRVRASAGTGFREPTFFENYSTGFTTGNPGLRPEQGSSREVAVAQTLFGGRLDLEVTTFAQRFQNMIDYTGGTTACGYSYCNVARADANGEEYEAQVHIAPALSASLGFTHLDTRVVTPGFDTTSGGLYQAGQRLIRRPPTSWNAAVTSALPDRGAFDARLSYVGERSDRDFRPYPAVPVVLPAYFRVDVGGRFDVFREAGGTSAAVTLRVENLTDVNYQSVFNFRAPRRTVLAGCRVTF